MKIALFLPIFMTLLCICHGSPHSQHCQRLSGVTLEEIDFSPKDVDFDTVPLKVKCFAKCLIAHNLGDDGKIDANKVDNAVLRCKERYDNYVIKNDADRCDYAFRALICYAIQSS
ncbi:hypothetical protein KR093_004160 [Drosophila rubida]|uniref:Uncharacterized protein n=1 Tax=Drosophila rubida TaxID=30044 RepID=A0AAD4PFW8_9MUSC|nr:hypothetical protein KR093_004160 [Drosophila rubida]